MSALIPVWHIKRTSCISSQKYFPIASVDREKSENHSDIYFMAFALKGTGLTILKEKVISTCGRGHYVMQKSCFTSRTKVY